MKDVNLNSHKLAYHPERVRQWYSTGDCVPIYVEVGLTNICNHRCVYCGFDQEKGRDVLETEVLLRNFEDMGEYGVKSICFAGAGEPLLHKDFSTLVRGAKKSGLDVAFSTNVALFNRNKAEETIPYTNWIRFSVDAASAETHARIHGTSTEDFPKVVDNLKSAVDVKKKGSYLTTLGVQFLLLEENAHELFDFARMCKKIGVDNIQIKPYSHHPTSKNDLHVNYAKFEAMDEDLQKLATDNFKVFFRIKREEIQTGEKSYKICRSLPFWAVINEKGNVIPCHVFYSENEFVYGNIHENTFSEIWESQRRKEVIKKACSMGSESCKRLGCRGDSINKYLEDLSSGKTSLDEVLSNGKDIPPHVNFI